MLSSSLPPPFIFFFFNPTTNLICSVLSFNQAVNTLNSSLSSDLLQYHSLTHFLFMPIRCPLFPWPRGSTYTKILPRLPLPKRLLRTHDTTYIPFSLSLPSKDVFPTPSPFKRDLPPHQLLPLTFFIHKSDFRVAAARVKQIIAPSKRHLV